MNISILFNFSCLINLIYLKPIAPNSFEFNRNNYQSPNVQN